MNNNVTIVQIAQESGVSIATVSRVLSGSAPVSEKTRKKVEAVIQKHRYNPNSVMQKITAVPHEVVAVVIPDIRNSFYSTLYMNIRVRLEQAGYFVIMYNLEEPLFDPSMQRRKEIEYLQTLTLQKVSGVIIMGGQCILSEQDPDYLDALKKLAESTPVIITGKKIPGIPAHFTIGKTSTGLSLVLNYLVSQGHKRIGFICGELSISRMQIRTDAFYELSQRLGYEFEPELVVSSGYSLSDGYYAATQLLQLQKPITAIVAITDTVALGALRACIDYRKTVPGDISLTSCYQVLDNDYLTPRLTSVDEHSGEYAQRLVHFLIADMRGEEQPNYHEIYPKLVIRESSGPAPILRQTWPK